MSKPSFTSALQKLPLSEGAMRGALFICAALLALVGLFYVAVGMAGLYAGPIGLDLAAERDRVALQMGARARELREEFRRAADEPHFRADVAAGAFDDAARRMRRQWSALSDAQIFSARVEDSITGETQQAGYGRLAVLGAAVLSNEVVIGLVGRPGNLAIGLALTLREDGRAEAVAYGEVDLGNFVDLVDSLQVGAGLIELRHERELVTAVGDPGLRGWAIATPVASTPFSLALALPRSATGRTPIESIVIGAVLLVLTVVLFGYARRMRFDAGDGHQGPTFAEALAQEVAQEASTRVTKAGDQATAKEARKAAPTPASLATHRSIFRAYDIRGVVGETLDNNVARLIGQAVGSVIREKGLREVVVGRDGRLSGPQLAGALIDGLRAAGCDVIDIGQAATPVVYFASYHLHAGSCVAVTGSHNPPNYNGFKIVVGEETLSGDAIQDLYERIAENRLQSGGQGGLQVMDVSRDYIDRISSDVQLERRMRVVVDCGNGVAGAIAPDVLDAIGAAAESLYCEVDGNFPNHHPDPSDPENLRDLITSVQRTGAELGLAFDGDGDRLGVVTRSGRVIYPDRVLMLFAQDVLSRNPGAAVIYDVKCTGHLSGQILRHGGSPIMWKTGHSLIKAKMRETGAELAGEMSGHFFFKERWYGFDDGIYAAARLLEILAADDRDPDEIFAELPDSISTPELKVPMVEGEHYAFMEKFRERARFEGAKIVTIDGVRADWSDGWGLVRCSNTTPSLVLRFDADSDAALLRIQDAFRSQIESVQQGLPLPF